MSNEISELANRSGLRVRAVSQLNKDDPGPPHAGTARALGVLHELASSPSTAADALALLHELQVHQVELDLMAEELRASRAELEMSLQRQIELYDAMPAGCLTVDPGGTVREVNLSGAALLGSGRDELVGQGLDSFFTPQSCRLLLEMVVGVSEGRRTPPRTLQLLRRNGEPRPVCAAVSPDPGGPGVVVALMDAVGADQ